MKSEKISCCRDEKTGWFCKATTDKLPAAVLVPKARKASYYKPPHYAVLDHNYKIYSECSTLELAARKALKMIAFCPSHTIYIEVPIIKFQLRHGILTVGNIVKIKEMKYAL